MRVFCYSIFDKAAESFSQPFFSAAKGLAIRSFIDLAQDQQTNVFKYPDEFTLYELAVFDDVLGRLIPHETPDRIGTAAELAPRADSGGSVVKLKG